ncbi:uncharacterized protein BBA_00001 [Beauveria bassiana ARSEF 2860]|uniref:Uncharacterized protein n=1 Tax=Beauveria bassiana (strain ARSEF 2860) TaxID=655819 RepID=J5K8E3_BEAB2|nr:uncharacterized protein BBA_00001 [Beauveria bassiana ARSEF 2860]EJP70371.1 hypothetical protein BBA_00001 [Beauveria bassiana ARSEF 2860]
MATVQSSVFRTTLSVATRLNRCICKQAPPFPIRLLEQHAVTSRDERDQLLTLLPALYRKESGDLAAVRNDEHRRDGLEHSGSPQVALALRIKIGQSG